MKGSRYPASSVESQLSLSHTQLNYVICLVCFVGFRPLQLRYLSGTERRQLLARGPRVENSQDSVSMGSTWDMTEDEGDDMLYTREVRDFGVAAGIVAPPRQ